MIIPIEAEKRELGKKSDLKTLRKSGKIPAVLYGEGKPGIPILVDDRDFRAQYKKGIGGLAFFEISLDGETFKTIIREKQIHPVSRQMVHLDFVELHPGKEIQVDVPIKYVGESVGVKGGGVLEISMRFLPVVTLPKDIIEDIEIDISGLDIGHGVHIKDLELGNMRTSLNDDVPLVTVHLPKGTKKDEEEEEEGEEAAEAQD